MLSLLFWGELFACFFGVCVCGIFACLGGEFFVFFFGVWGGDFCLFWASSAFLVGVWGGGGGRDFACFGRVVRIVFLVWGDFCLFWVSFSFSRLFFGVWRGHFLFFWASCLWGRLEAWGCTSRRGPSLFSTDTKRACFFGCGENSRELPPPLPPPPPSSPQPGEYLETSSGTGCLKCPAGTFGEAAGLTQCAECPPGRSSDFEARIWGSEGSADRGALRGSLFLDPYRGTQK